MGKASLLLSWYNVGIVRTTKGEKLELYMDTRQQKGKHDEKIAYWESRGLTLVTRKLDYGDYMIEGNKAVSVDTKADLCEIENNLIHDHKRLVRECDRAEADGVRLLFVIENKDGIYNLSQVEQWQNPRYWAWKFKHDRGSTARECTSGAKLRKIMRTFEERHNAEFFFCPPADSGRLVLNLLGKF